jgi:type II secretory pathway pseudopilin PulG
MPFQIRRPAADQKVEMGWRRLARMDRARMRRTIRTLRSDGGITIVELLVYMVMLGLLAAAGAALLITAVKSEPRIASRTDAIQQARVLQERFARELRQSYLVKQTPAPTSSQITFGTYLRRTSCGGSPQTNVTQTAIACQVSYSCASGTCTRTETNPDGSSTPLVQRVIAGLSSDAVFGYSPSATSPDYVTMRLVFPAAGGDDAITLEDGVDLRNR